MPGSDTRASSVQSAGSSKELGPGRRTISRRRLAAVTCGLLIVAVWLLDLATGALFIPTDRDAFRTVNPAYHHGFIPLTSSATHWGTRDYPFATNSLGMRDASPRRIAPRPSGRRIVFLGDSVVEGMGVTWEESFVGLIANRLEPEGVEVLNAGVVSYSPNLYDLRMRELQDYEGLHMDQLYVFIDISDILDELFYEGFRPVRSESWRMTAYRIDRFLKRRSFLWWTIRTPRAGRTRDPLFEAATAFWFDSIAPKELINADFIRDRARWTVDPQAFDRWGRRGLALALGNMARLSDRCRASGVQLVIVVHPWPEQINLRDRESLQVRIWKEFAAIHQAEFVNLFPLFINDRPAEEIIQRYFIPGDSHWSVAGHQLVADALLGRAGQRGRLDSVEPLPGE